MATAPTLATDGDTLLNTTTPKTASVGTSAANDVLVALRAMENASGNLSLPTQTSGPTFTEQATNDDTSSSKCETRIATAIATGANSNAISMAATGGLEYGCNAMRWTGSDGVGSAGTANPTANFNATTSTDNAALMVILGDWDAGDRSTVTCTIGGSSATKSLYLRDAAAATIVVFYLADCGTAGTKAVSLSSWTGTWSASWVEVKGAAGGGGGPTVKTLAALGVG